jgi:hypothetical protein
MLDGAKGVLVDCVAVIKVAHDERIDVAEFRQRLDQ